MGDKLKAEDMDFFVFIKINQDNPSNEKASEMEMAFLRRFYNSLIFRFDFYNLQLAVESYYQDVITPEMPKPLLAVLNSQSEGAWTIKFKDFSLVEK